MEEPTDKTPSPSTNGDTETSTVVPDSPKPLAFTIDFGNGKTFDNQRHKNLMDKFQKKQHRRGQSLSKIEDTTATTTKNHPLTGNLPRKSSFQSEGYFSSDEKTDRAKSARASTTKRGELTLQLKNVTSDRMTQSFPSGVLLPLINSPEIDLKVSSISPDLDLISPFTPVKSIEVESPKVLIKHASSPESTSEVNEVFLDGVEFDFDKSDTVSDTGTYTLDADNYSEEQKARMSIDREFKIEQVSLQRKTEDYIRSLSESRISSKETVSSEIITKSVQLLNFSDCKTKNTLKSPVVRKKPMGKVLSPIMSPTQNLSITQNVVGEEKKDKPLNNGECDILNKTFSKIMFPSPKAKQEGLDLVQDQGSVVSVTSSGAFRSKSEKEKKHERKYSLTKSEVQVQTYIDDKSNVNEGFLEPEVRKVSATITTTPKLTANIVNVQSIEVKKQNTAVDCSGVVSGNLTFGKVAPPTNLPPSVGGYSGKTSPSKIPSPIHTISRPRSRNSLSGLNLDLNSDSSLDTEIILKPTQNFINSLQQRLSLDSDPDSDYDAKYGIQLNNTAHLLKQRASHTRHNSLDDRTINNKLEHFQNKNLQGIDQTYSNVFNQYAPHNRVMHKIQNSPNNSPIRRSSSFSTKNQINVAAKNTNCILTQKESNISSPHQTRHIQRSSSTASIKPLIANHRRSSVSGDHQKIDRSQFGDTESSSEEDFEKNMQKRKDLANITNTRCNRAFSLRRARLDEPAPPTLKCPNTPEMRRKYHHSGDLKMEQRAISVDRKPMRTNDVQSRYLQNVVKSRGTPPPVQSRVDLGAKNVPKTMTSSATKTSNSSKPQTFSRTDSGRFSMRSVSKPPVSNTPKNLKKDPNGKKSGGARSISSLSSREVEFQNWKRRKSYDPMKAAAEGKKKEIAAKRQTHQNVMTQSYTESNHSQDSSPSHSSSVHRSQSFHGTAALEHLISSEEEEEDLTLSVDEGFSPPTPSPCELSPARASLRHTMWDRIHH